MVLSRRPMLAGVRLREVSGGCRRGAPSPAGRGRAGESRVVLRPLTVRDLQRIAASREGRRDAHRLADDPAGARRPRLHMEQVARLPAGLASFLVDRINAISGISTSRDLLEEMVQAPLAEACFVLAKEFGWTPEDVSGMTIGQILLYLEMSGREGGRHELAARRPPTLGARAVALGARRHGRGARGGLGRAPADGAGGGPSLEASGRPRSRSSPRPRRTRPGRPPRGRDGKRGLRRAARRCTAGAVGAAVAPGRDAGASAPRPGSSPSSEPVAAAWAATRCRRRSWPSTPRAWRPCSGGTPGRRGRTRSLPVDVHDRASATRLRRWRVVTLATGAGATDGRSAAGVGRPWVRPFGSPAASEPTIAAALSRTLDSTLDGVRVDPAWMHATTPWPETDAARRRARPPRPRRLRPPLATGRTDRAASPPGPCVGPDSRDPAPEVPVSVTGSPGGSVGRRAAPPTGDAALPPLDPGGYRPARRAGRLGPEACGRPHAGRPATSRTTDSSGLAERIRGIWRRGSPPPHRRPADEARCGRCSRR